MIRSLFHRICSKRRVTSHRSSPSYKHSKSTASSTLHRDSHDPHRSSIDPKDHRVMPPIPEKKPMLRGSVVYPLLAALLALLVVALQLGVDSFSKGSPEKGFITEPFASADPRNLDISIPKLSFDRMIDFSESSEESPSHLREPGIPYESIQNGSTTPPIELSVDDSVPQSSSHIGSPLFFATAKSATSPERIQSSTSSESYDEPFTVDPSIFVGGSNSVEATSYTSQNMQRQKEDFFGNPEKSTALILPTILPQRLTIYPGTIIPISLVTGINSDLPGVVIGRVTSPVYNSSSGENLLIPAGTTLMGRYDSHISYGQRRVLIVWNFMTRRDGISLDLQGMPGTDLQGFSGADGYKVNTHFWKKMGAIGLSTLLDIGKHELQYQASQWEGNSENVANDFGSSAGSGIDQYTSFIMQQQPTITIPAGSSLRVIVTDPLMLPIFEDTL